MARTVPEGLAGYSAIQRVWNAFQLKMAQIVPSTYAADLTCNGSASYTIVHGMGTKDIIVQVLSKDDSATVLVDVIRNNENTITIIFGESQPSGTSYRVLITQVRVPTTDNRNNL